MASGIGELNVGVSASTGQASKNIRKFRGDLKDLKGGAAAASQGIGLMTVATAGLTLAALAAAAALRMALSGIDRLDNLAKTADKLGLATERLAGLRLAAEETGVASNTLDMGIQRMVRRVAEASIGLGEAQGALKELGIDAVELNTLAPDQQFRRIASALEQVPGQAHKVRLAFKLFDSEGVALVNTLKLGSAGLDEMQAKASKLGIAIDRETAAKAEKAKGALTEMGAAVTGWANELTIALAPSITHVANSARDFAVWVRTLGGLLEDEATASGLAAQAAQDKAQADERAAAAATAKAEAEAKVTAEFQKQLQAARDRRIDAEQGAGTSEHRRNQDRFGEARAQQILNEKELEEITKRRADQEKTILNLRQRLDDIGKTQLQKEREALLRENPARAMQDKINGLFDQLEQAEAEQKRAEDRKREAEQKRRDAEREKEREAEKAKQRRGQLFEANFEAANRANAANLDARSAEGFAALRSSVNQTDRQSLMLEIAKQQKKEAEQANMFLDIIASNTVTKPDIIYSLN